MPAVGRCEANLPLRRGLKIMCLIFSPLTVAFCHPSSLSRGMTA
jgi:hypothetical protein